MLVDVRRGRVSCGCMARRAGFAGVFVCFTWMLLLAVQVEGQNTCSSHQDCNHYSPNNLAKCTLRANGQYYCDCKLAVRKFGDACQSACNITDKVAVCVNGVCKETTDLFGTLRQCKCNPGWRKDNNDLCRTAICNSPCQNGGSCVGPNQCRCTAGYTGLLCELRANCSLLPPPANGRLFESLLRGVQRLQFECNKGFIAEGYTTLLCVNGSWNVPPPMCKDIDECSLGISNCNEQCRSCKNTIGSFSCEEKPGMENFVYNLVSKTCQPIGRKSCTVLSSIVNGRISYNAVLRNTSRSVPDGTTASLKCHNGFIPSDSSRTVLKCADGKWNDLLSRCKPIPRFCNVQLSVVDGDISYKPSLRWDRHTLYNGTVAEVKCNDGYQVLDNEKTIAVCVDGQWNHWLTACVKACKRLPLEQGMKIDYIPAIPTHFRQSVPQETTAKLRCTNRTRPREPSQTRVYCNKGAWSGSLSDCVAADSKDSNPGAASSSDDATTIIVPVVILGIVLPALIVLFLIYYRSRSAGYKYSVPVGVKDMPDQEDLRPSPSLVHKSAETVDGDGAAANNFNVHYASRDVAMGGKSPKPNANIVAALTQVPVPKSDTLERPSLAAASGEGAPHSYHGYAAVTVESKKTNETYDQMKKKPMKPPPKATTQPQQRQDEGEQYEDVAWQERNRDASQATSSHSNSPPQAHQTSVVVHNLPSVKKALKPVKKSPSPPKRSSPPIDEYEYDTPSVDAATPVMDVSFNGETPVEVPCRTVSMPTNTGLHVGEARGERAGSKTTEQNS